MNDKQKAARWPEQSCMDTVTRALEETGDEADRVVIIIQDKEGGRAQFFSNARSESEMFGMVWMVLNFASDVEDQ